MVRNLSSDPPGIRIFRVCWLKAKMEVILVTAIRKERPTLLTAAVDGRTAITWVEGAPDFKRQLVVRLRKKPGCEF